MADFIKVHFIGRRAASCLLKDGDAERADSSHNYKASGEEPDAMMAVCNHQEAAAPPLSTAASDKLRMRRLGRFLG